MSPPLSLLPSTSGGTDVSPSPVSPVGARPSGCPRGPRGGNSLPATARCCSRRSPLSPRVGTSLGFAKHPVPSCPHAVPEPPGPGYGSPVPAVSSPVPSLSREPLSIPRLFPFLSLSIPVSPELGYVSMFPLCPVSLCPGCSLARDVPFPGKCLFPRRSYGRPSARRIPFPGVFPFPGRFSFQPCPSARGVTFHGMPPFPECPAAGRVPSLWLSSFLCDTAVAPCCRPTLHDVPVTLGYRV